MAVVYVNSDCVHATRHAYQFEEKSATVSNKIMHIHTSSSCISMTKTLYRNHLFAMVDTVSMALLKLLQTLLSLCEYCLRIGNLLRFKWPIDQNSSADNRPKKVDNLQTSNLERGCYLEIWNRRKWRIFIIMMIIVIVIMICSQESSLIIRANLALLSRPIRISQFPC